MAENIQADNVKTIIIEITDNELCQCEYIEEKGYRFSGNGITLQYKVKMKCHDQEFEAIDYLEINPRNYEEVNYYIHLLEGRALRHIIEKARHKLFIENVKEILESHGYKPI